MVIRHRQDLDQWFLGFHLFLASLCGGAARWPMNGPSAARLSPAAAHFYETMIHFIWRLRVHRATSWAGAGWQG